MTARTDEPGSPVNGPRIGELCAGYGGLGMGVQAVLGGELAWVSEYEPPTKANPNPKQGAARILAHRFPGVPNLGDMTTVDWSTVESVDVLTGGTPCQDLSDAGKRAGMTEGTRSNLWVVMRDAIEQLRPGLVVWENVRGAYSAPADSELESREGRLGIRSDGPVLRALGRVLGDLSELGFDAEWVGLRAADVGAPHGRFRVFIVAWPASDSSGNAWRFGNGNGRALAHPADDRREWAGCAWHGRSGSPHHSDVAAHAEGHGREADRLAGRDGAERSGARRHHGAPPDAHGDGLESVGRLHTVGRDADGCGGADVAWGQYEPAVRRWEQLTRPAPAPTEIGAKGQPRLSPAFVEWMQGLPAGWVTAVPGLTRNEQLKALGNGVVPAQAAHALRLLLADQLKAAA